MIMPVLRLHACPVFLFKSEFSPPHRTQTHARSHTLHTNHTRNARTHARTHTHTHTHIYSALSHTVAHRLHTIIDSDRILVMRDGFAEELDEPHRLLMNPDSLLTSMVKNTDANAPLLFKMAKEAFEKKRKANGVEGEKERINGVGEERTKERKEVDNEEKKREEKKSKSRRPSGADSDPANASPENVDVVVVSQEVSLSLPEVAVSPPDQDDDRDVVA